MRDGTSATYLIPLSESLVVCLFSLSKFARPQKAISNLSASVHLNDYCPTLSLTTASSINIANQKPNSRLDPL